MHVNKVKRQRNTANRNRIAPQATKGAQPGVSFTGKVSGMNQMIRERNPFP